MGEPAPDPFPTTTSPPSIAERFPVLRATNIERMVRHPVVEPFFKNQAMASRLLEQERENYVARTDTRVQRVRRVND
jgi:hypothetical protein